MLAEFGEFFGEDHSIYMEYVEQFISLDYF